MKEVVYEFTNAELRDIQRGLSHALDKQPRFKKLYTWFYWKVGRTNNKALVWILRHWPKRHSEGLTLSSILQDEIRKEIDADILKQIHAHVNKIR